MAGLHRVNPVTLEGREIEEPIEWIVRPWGWYGVLGEPEHEPIAAVKILYVEPGQALSLQTHALRRERWSPVTPGLRAIIGNEALELLVGHTYEIGIGVPHRLFTSSDVGGSVVETMYGTYDENDITRLSDNYNRVRTT